VAVGESLTQKIVVTGSGNLNLMGDLPLDELDGFKVYRDQPVVEIERVGRRALAATRRSAAALVPLTPGGDVSIRRRDWSYFDPSRESYVTAAAPAIALDVVPGAATRICGSPSRCLRRRQGGGAHPRRRSAADRCATSRWSRADGWRGACRRCSPCRRSRSWPCCGRGGARDRLASDVGLRRRRSALRHRGRRDRSRRRAGAA
jgi:hypothetical protein